MPAAALSPASPAAAAAQELAGDLRAVGPEDAEYVLREVKEISKAMMGQFDPRNSSDPDILSKASGGRSGDGRGY